MKSHNVSILLQSLKVFTGLCHLKIQARSVSFRVQRSHDEPWTKETALGRAKRSPPRPASEAQALLCQ